MRHSLNGIPSLLLRFPDDISYRKAVETCVTTTVSENTIELMRRGSRKRGQGRGGIRTTCPCGNGSYPLVLTYMLLNELIGIECYTSP